jgi:FkbM family methyltransferase
MSSRLLGLIKEGGGVNDILKLALYSRKFFKNWLSSLIIASLSYTGIAKKRYVTIKCVDNCISEIPLMAFIRLLYSQKMNIVKRYDCCKNAVELINGVTIPIDEITNGDVYALIAPLRGWKFDKNRKVWLKHGVEFRHIYYSILEIFDEGAYETVNCKDKDVVDVGAFVGDSAIYFVLRGARRIIAVEPHPKAYKELVENIRLNRLEKRIIPINAALSSVSGSINISLKDVDTASIAKNSLRRFIRYYEDVHTYRVKAITLGEIIKLYDVEGGVLKMDCEGCEYDIILNDFDHVALFDELMFEYHTYATGMLVQSLIRILSKNFSCRIIEGGSTQGIIHCIKRQNN